MKSTLQTVNFSIPSTPVPIDNLLLHSIEPNLKNVYDSVRSVQFIILRCFDMNHHLTKSPHVEIEAMGENLMLLNTSTLELYLLNDVASILWEAIDHFPNSADLLSLLAEAKPEFDPTTLEHHLDDFISTLSQKGFLIAQPSQESTRQ